MTSLIRQLLLSLAIFLLFFGVGVFFSVHTTSAQGVCLVSNVVFNEAPNFIYDEAESQTVSVSFFANNCLGQEIQIEIWEINDGYQSTFGYIEAVEDVVANVSQVVIPEKNSTKITLTYKPGDIFCEQEAVFYGEGADCDYFVKYKTPSLATLTRATGIKSDLRYECSDDCGDVNWSFINVMEDENLAQTGTSNLFSLSDGLCAQLLAENPNSADDIYNTCYELLTPLPIGNRNFGDFEIINEPIDLNNDEIPDYRRQYLVGVVNFGSIINILVQIILGLLGLGAVIMIVIAGFQYMSSVNPNTKGAAKEKIINAILGLLIAFGSFIILNTINPNLLRIDPRIESVTLDLGGDPNSSFSPFTSVSFGGGTITKLTIENVQGVNCPMSGGPNMVKTIAKSFEGGVTYRYGGKGGDLNPGQKYPLTNSGNNGTEQCEPTQQICREFCPEGSACIDCSGFVALVRMCAGMNFVNEGTATIFNNQSIKINNLQLVGFDVVVNNDPEFILQPGDLVGSASGGHVGIYVGDGQYAHSTAANNGRQPGKGVQFGDLFATFNGGNNPWLTHVRRNQDI